MKGNGISYTPLGGGREIGASAYHLLFGSMSVLFDAGMRPQGSDVYLNPGNIKAAQPNFDLVDDVHFIFVSHGHYDHCAAFMFARKKFPGAKAYMTIQTREFCKMHLSDIARRMKHSRDWRGAQPLFSEEDVEKALSAAVLVKPIEHGGMAINLGYGLWAIPHHAGHMLGAISVEFVYNERSVIFTGDISWTDQHFTRGASHFTPHAPVALLGTEATYLNTCFHEKDEDARGDLVAATMETLRRGGNVLIPTLSINRAQEIWMDFYEQRDTIPISRVFLDGGTQRYFDIFKRYAYTPKAHLLRHAQFVPHGWSGRRWEKEFHRGQLLKQDEPFVVIASGAMLQEGSASYHWADMLLPGKKNALFFTSYLDPCSAGFELLQQMKKDEEVIKLFGGESVRGCEVRRFNLSAHTDKHGTEAMIGRLDPDVVVFHHGDPKEVVPYLAQVGARDPNRGYFYPGTGEEVTL
ncbi:MAG: MBL fold metallo-hydrolase [Patescibacteria group bacterium]